MLQVEATDASVLAGVHELHLFISKQLLDFFNGNTIMTDLILDVAANKDILFGEVHDVVPHEIVCLLTAPNIVHYFRSA